MSSKKVFFHGSCLMENLYDGLGHHLASSEQDFVFLGKLWHQAITRNSLPRFKQHLYFLIVIDSNKLNEGNNG